MSAITTTIRGLLSASFTVSLFVAPLALAQLEEFSGWVPVEAIETQSSVVELAEWMMPAQKPEAAPMSMATEGPDQDAVAETTRPEPMMTGTRKVVRPSSNAVADTKVATAASAPAKKGKKRKCGEPSPGIDKIAPANFSVERALLSSYASHPARLNALGWVAKHKNTEGKADGFRLGGIKCGTDLHEAGFRNGDIVHSVNGKAIHNVAQALLAYTTLKRSDLVDVDITRKGSSKTLTYHLG